MATHYIPGVARSGHLLTRFNRGQRWRISKLGTAEKRTVGRSTLSRSILPFKSVNTDEVARGIPQIRLHYPAVVCFCQILHFCGPLSYYPNGRNEHCFCSGIDLDQSYVNSYEYSKFRNFLFIFNIKYNRFDLTMFETCSLFYFDYVSRVYLLIPYDLTNKKKKK